MKKSTRIRNFVILINEDFSYASYIALCTKNNILFWLGYAHDGIWTTDDEIQIPIGIKNDKYKGVLRLFFLNISFNINYSNIIAYLLNKSKF